MPCLCVLLNFYNCATIKELCPSGWLPSPTSESCIKLYHENKTWDEARSTCQVAGGDLIIKIDGDKENLIRAQNLLDPYDEFWIGLNDRDIESDFKWLDDPRTVQEVDWEFDQPDDHLKNEDCVIWIPNRSKNAKLKDRPCSNTCKFICEVFPDCPVNFYGPGCSLKCSVHCNGWNSKCDSRGMCYYGCTEGYKGKRCTEGREFDLNKVSNGIV
ncbi:hypothetical protein RRG08_000282 [Elysia crispata]|uniref:C-type lectin domain-containing protein n=1 Tax=Elysia crispata TaxID=231223 RepID=A0AAE0ZSS8_9GAST|nr:hypothetical protein RRG08_000282 [Elysia crispata]